MRPTDDPRNIENNPRGLHEPPPLTESRRFETEAETVTPASHDSRTLGDLIKELRDETTLLFRQEIALAKSEMSEKTARYVRNIGYLVVGAAVGYLALALLLVAAMFGIIPGLRAAGLGPNIYAWLAPVIIGLIVGIIGYAMIQKGISTLRRESIVPSKTVASLQENKEWIGRKIK
jgi:hypothetical protein